MLIKKFLIVLGYKLTRPGEISELYDDNIATCFNKIRQIACVQPVLIDMLDLTEIPSNFGNNKATVKLSVQDISTCSPNWINVINTDKSAGTAVKCDLEADYSVSDGVCFWRCPCDGNCTVALVQNKEVIRVFYDRDFQWDLSENLSDVLFKFICDGKHTVIEMVSVMHLRIWDGKDI